MNIHEINFLNIHMIFGVYIQVHTYAKVDFFREPVAVYSMVQRKKERTNEPSNQARWSTIEVITQLSSVGYVPAYPASFTLKSFTLSWCACFLFFPPPFLFSSLSCLKHNNPFDPHHDLSIHILLRRAPNQPTYQPSSPTSFQTSSSLCPRWIYPVNFFFFLSFFLIFYCVFFFFLIGHFSPQVTLYLPINPQRINLQENIKSGVSLQSDDKYLFSLQ